MPHDPAGRTADGPVLECWMVLAALAEQTAAVALGSLVLGNTYRHPAVVAHMAATLDQISQGRLVLGNELLRALLSRPRERQGQ